jgi:hypothetical protein
MPVDIGQRVQLAGVIGGVMDMTRVGARRGAEIGRCEPPEVKRVMEIESGRLQQVQLVRPDNSLGAVGGAQLAVGVCDVTLDRGQTDD